jgi:hypothetical protein
MTRSAARPGQQRFVPFVAAFAVLMRVIFETEGAETAEGALGAREIDLGVTGGINLVSIAKCDRFGSALRCPGGRL